MANTMMIVALAPVGHEYVYNPNSAHRVSKAKANEICKALNEIHFRTPEGKHWHVYEIDKYDGGYETALLQWFKILKGSLRRYHDPILNYYGSEF